MHNGLRDVPRIKRLLDGTEPRPRPADADLTELPEAAQRWCGATFDETTRPSAEPC